MVKLPKLVDRRVRRPYPFVDPGKVKGLGQGIAAAVKKIKDEKAPHDKISKG